MKHNIFTPARLLVFTLIVAGLVALPMLTYQAKAGQDHVVYLLATMKNAAGGTQPTPLPNGSPEQIALDQINFYRRLAGAPPVQLHPALVTAAKNHANYTVINKNDPAAWVNGPHGEVAGKPGYTGVSSGDRAAVAGYPWAAGWEVMGYVGDPTGSVDGLISTVFHRVGILEPTMRYAGYGNARGSSYADVIDFGRDTNLLIGEPGVIVFPSVSQTDVPLYGAPETPDPLPPGATYPIGYPITIQPIYGTALRVSQVELHDGSGALVNAYPSPADCGTACYAFIPASPLIKATTYTAHIVGVVDDVPFDKTWTFTTETCADPLDC